MASLTTWLTIICIELKCLLGFMNSIFTVCVIDVFLQKMVKKYLCIDFSIVKNQNKFNVHA